MALTAFQRDVCRLIAANRVASGESYVAGGAALNLATGSSRLSRNIDLFHDRADAVAASWDTDRATLSDAGFIVRAVRERPGFVEASVERGGGIVTLQWTADSAFRFFPLVGHDELGLTLHPFDLATNKVLALVGRLEPRDWVDVISCHVRIQPLGFLAWAACGKDPGFGPASILEYAGRSARYTQADLASLAFETSPPDAAELSKAWHAMHDDARRIVGALPAEHAGTCVVDAEGVLWRADAAASIRAGLDDGTLRFHRGSLRGALPRIRGA